MSSTRATSDPSASFEPYRRRLCGLAYRMLGSITDAEDAVQETFGDLHALTQMLASDVRIVTDGGGKVRSALEVIEGAEHAPGS